MAEKNIFACKLFLSLSISDFTLFFMWKLHPPSKSWDLQALPPVKLSPLFENLVGSWPPPQNLNSTSDSRVFHVYGLKGIALGSRWGYQKTAKIDLNKFKLHIVTLKCFCHFFSFCVYGMLIYDAAKVSRCNLSFSFKILHFCSFFPFIET